MKFIIKDFFFEINRQKHTAKKGGPKKRAQTKMRLTMDWPGHGSLFLTRDRVGRYNRKDTP